MNRQEFTEMAQHIDHEVKLILDDDGDINLYCSDCEVIIETWERPPEPSPWQGQRYFKETGAEPNIGDIMMERLERTKDQRITAEQFCNIVEASFREGKHE